MTAHVVASRIAALIAALGIGMTAACSSGGSAHPASPGGAGRSSAGNAAADSPTGIAAPAAGTGKATCSQLIAAQVQPILVRPITKVSAATIPDGVSIDATGTAQQCTFATSESSQAITITVVGGKDADPFYASQAASITPAAVAGIGQKAVRDSGGATATVTAEANGVACSVATSGDDQIPGVAALEAAAGHTSRIGDANHAAVSTAMGTLCNYVFGSGSTTPDLSTLLSAAAKASSASTDGSALPTDFSLPSDAASS